MPRRLRLGLLGLLFGVWLSADAVSAESLAGSSAPTGLRQALERREYEAGSNPEGLQAPNRAHNLRTYFEPAGIRVHDRTAAGSPELLSLSLTGVGRGDTLESVPPGVVVPDGARVEVRRPDLVEWYENSEAGLEQGFTLNQRRAGEAELVLELAVESASATFHGDRMTLATLAGRTLAYAELAAADASGRSLPARFELLSPHTLRIAVDDAGAIYPVTIDPLLSATADAQLESNQASALLGSSVASAGDVNGDGYADVIVGAPQYDAGQTDEGAAFIFLGNASGIASGNPTTAATQLESNQADAQLGKSVAGAGDVNGDGYADVIVGSAYAAVPHFPGAAFVFLGSASGIASGNPSTAAAEIDTAQSSGFGSSVAGAGDVNGDGYADVIVGAQSYDNGQTDEGAAFVFLGSASGISSGTSASASAQLESNQASAQLGFSVASAGDVNADGYSDVIVGANLYDAGQTDEGAAFVFLGSASGIASGNPATPGVAQLESNQASAFLGGSVAGAGDVNGDGYADVIVGASFYDAGETDEGAAFVFLGSASGIASGNPLTAAAQLEANQIVSLFGSSVAGAGDVNGDGYADVIVGATDHDSGVITDNEGAAFVFLGSASGIASGGPASAFAQLESNQAGSHFGNSVSAAGDVNGDGYADVIVGNRLYDAGQTDEGAAFVYLGGAKGIVDGDPATAAARLEADLASAQLGWSVASAGDVNGDGYSDVIVGAFNYDNGQVSEGAAFVFLGGSGGIANASPATAAAVLESNQVSAQMGESVASAGDVNGDGYGDVIVGANFYDNGQANEGAAFLFLGGPSGIASGNPTTAAAVLESDQAGAWMGESVASAGDVNGDGYSDVIVGAHRYTQGQTEEGAAFVFLGSPSGIASGNPATAAAVLQSDQASSNLGYRVASAGDINGDGYGDVVVAAHLYDDGETNEGAAFVFLGGASGIASGSPATAAAVLESNQAGAQFGASVAGAGDVDGDGFADVIVGAPQYNNGEPQEGVAFLFEGSASGIASGGPSSAAAVLESNLAFAWMGTSVASAGDVNADGYADVIAGALHYQNGQTSEGAAFVFLGSSSGIASGGPATAVARLEGNQVGAGLGMSCASAGDVNGDGFADVIVGAFLYDNGQTDEGAAFVYYGNGNRTGQRVLATQRRGSAVTTRIQPWGASYDPTFEGALRSYDPNATNKVKIELQACPSGVPFGHPSCFSGVSASWVDSGGNLKLKPPGLTDGALYRWRARILYAPSTVTQPGITAPPKPAHGPWRRFNAQAVEADVRVGVDTDLDGLRNSIDPDDDNDGLSDVAEAALGTDPLNPDQDGDAVLDGADNCPFIVNPIQDNSDAFAAGDLCQCGDVTGDGTLTPIDYTRARELVAGRTPSGAADPDRCDVTGDAACDVEDLAVLDRLTSGASAAITYGCPAYTGP